MNEELPEGAKIEYPYGNTFTAAVVYEVVGVITKSGYESKSDFQNIYIMGNDPYFTAYYFEVRKFISMTAPLNAVIMSGRVDKEYILQTDTINHTTDTIESPVIKDFRIGFETMVYYNKENILYPSLIANGSLPLPGNVWILKSLGDLRYGEFEQ